MSTMPVGCIRLHYAHLIQEICLQYFLRPNSERTCSNVRNVRIVSCFCNGGVDAAQARYRWSHISGEPCVQKRASTGSGRGGEKRTERQRARRLLHQKNGAIVRQVVGYGRLIGEQA